MRTIHIAKAEVVMMKYQPNLASGKKSEDAL